LGRYWQSWKNYTKPSQSTYEFPIGHEETRARISTAIGEATGATMAVIIVPALTNEVDDKILMEEVVGTLLSPTLHSAMIPIVPTPDGAG